MQVVATAELCSAFFIGICFLSLLVSGRLRRSSDYSFSSMLLLDFVMLVSDGLWCILSPDGSRSDLIFLLWISYFCFYLLLANICIYVYAVINRQSEEPLSKVWYVVPCSTAILGLIYFFICLNSGIIKIGPVGYYFENTYYMIWQFFGYAICLWIVIMILTQRKKLSVMQFFQFFAIIVFPAFVAYLRSVSDCPNLLYTSISMMIFVVYVMDYIEEQQRFLKQKERVTNAELTMMISQVQPHFLYNMFNTIYYLCAKDVELAQEAIGEFSDYFRTNLDSISKKEPVPFEEELKYLRQYVYLEKLRFEDKLEVVFDIESTDFVVPVLSIRPLVENAIKHGVGKTDRKLVVTISTKELEDCYEVCVLDNGPGYDPANKPMDGRSHVGLENLRQRLILISDASLSISGTKDVGTRAVIRFKK